MSRIYIIRDIMEFGALDDLDVDFAMKLQGIGRCGKYMLFET